MNDLNPLNNILFRAIPNVETLTKISKGYKNIVFFIDFNNCIRGMYYPENMEMILTYIVTHDFKIPDTLIKEWGKFQSFLETWAVGNNKKLKTIYFCETGQSYYHKRLLKDYKAGRNQQLFKIPDSLLSSFKEIDEVKEYYRNFKHMSWNWITEISKKSGISSLMLNNIDADFFPEYLFRKTDFYNEETCYVIISSDGDMIQTLDLGDNIFIVNGSEEINYNNWHISKSYLRKAFVDTDLTPTPDKIILFKAIAGDSSDKIKGIPGIGGKTFTTKILPYISDDIRGDDLIKLKEEFKRINIENPKNKPIQKIIDNWDTFENCIKLVSFNHLIEHLYSVPSKTKELEDVLNETEILNYDVVSNFNGYLKTL